MHEPLCKGSLHSQHNWSAAEKFIGTRDRVEVTTFLQAFWWQELRYASAMQFARRCEGVDEQTLARYRRTLAVRRAAHVVPEATHQARQARRRHQQERKARRKATTKARTRARAIQ